MEKNNTKFYVVITILIAIITFLLGLIAGMLFNIKLPAKEGTVSNGQPSIDMVSISETTSSNSISEDNTPDNNTGKNNPEEIYTNTGNGSSLVFQGYKFIIPDEYGVLFTEDVGPVPYMNDIFQMRLVIKAEDDETFRGYYDNPATLSEKAIAAGGVIIDECRLVTFKGRDYFVFRVDLGGDDCVVFRTRIDSENSFAGNMVIQSKSITEEDYMNVISGLAESIEKSDKPDTTEDEYINNKYNVDVGTVKEEATINTKYFNLTYKVPSIFKSTDDTFTFENDEETVMYCDSYMTDEFDTADVYISRFEDGAKEYVSGNGRFEGCKLQTFEKSGHTFYWVETIDDWDGEKIKKILVACDLSDNWIYYLDIYSENMFELKDLENFFLITVN